MYRVLKFFRDLQDNNHAYHEGEIFPHGGMAVSEERLMELSTDANRRHEPLIALVDDKPEEPVENRVEVTQEEEPANDFMNPPEEPVEEPEQKEDAPKPKKKRGRPRNDAK